MKSLEKAFNVNLKYGTLDTKSTVIYIHVHTLNWWTVFNLIYRVL